MMYLDRRHYQLLIAIRRHGQLSLAGKALGLSQPAASHQMREAERRLGITLFEKFGRTIRLTAAAERLLDAGLYAEDTLSTAEREAVEICRGSLTVLRIGIGNYDHAPWMYAAIKSLCASYTLLNVEIVRLANYDLKTATEKGSIDLFIAPQDADFVSLNSTDIFDDELVAILSPQYSSVVDLRTDAAFFENRRVLAFQYKPTHGYEYERFYSPAGVVPQRLLRVESVRAIIDLVRLDFGVGILPRMCITEDAVAGKILVSDLVPRKLSIVWKVYVNHKFMSENGNIINDLIGGLRSAAVKGIE